MKAKTTTHTYLRIIVSPAPDVPAHLTPADGRYTLCRRATGHAVIAAPRARLCHICAAKMEVKNAQR